MNIYIVRVLMYSLCISVILIKFIIKTGWDYNTYRVKAMVEDTRSLLVGTNTNEFALCQLTRPQ